MKKLLSMLTALVLLLSACPAIADDTMYVMTGGGWLNLRKAPDTRAEIREFIPNGSKVTLLEAAGDGWGCVRWKNAEGYVQLRYLGTQDDQLLKDHPDARQIYSDSLFTYVRAEKDSLSPVLYTAEADTVLTVLGDDGVWSHVKCHDRWGILHEGYVLSANLSGRALPDQARQQAAEDMLVLEKAVANTDQMMYLYPESGSATTEMLPAGTRVTVEAVRYPWCRVSCGALGGWVLMEEITLTGETETRWQDRTFYDYVASHYTATVPSGTLKFYIYPRSELDAVQSTVAWAPDKPLIVLEKDTKQYGQVWAKVWDGGEVYGWVLASQLDIGQTRETYEYEHNVPVYTTAVAYAGANGARVFRDGSAISPVKYTIPADTELHITLNANGYAHVEYEISPGNVVNGYIPYEDLELGFADRTDEQYPNHRKEEIREQMAEAEARALADAYLAERYGADFGEGWIVKALQGSSPSGDQVYYDLSYFLNDEYRYAVRIHAVTGAVLYASAYGGFFGDPEGDRVSRTEAQTIAEAALKKKDASFEPADYTLKWMLGEGNTSYIFKYMDGDKTVYSAEILIQMGYVKHANAVRRDQNAANKADKESLSDEQLRALSDKALKEKYPAFDASMLAAARERTVKNGIAQMEFAYYADDGTYVYASCLNAMTGEVLFTADYTSYEYDPPVEDTEKEDVPDMETESELMGEGAARSIADSALRGKYPAFAGDTFGYVRCQLRTVDASFDTPHYQFDYFAEDGELMYEILIHAVTGRILYVFGALPGEGNGAHDAPFGIGLIG